MSTFLRLVDGRTVAVKPPLVEVAEIIEDRRKRDPDCFYEFKIADNTNEVRRIRLSAIIEYERGHSK